MSKTNWKEKCGCNRPGNCDHQVDPKGQDPRCLVCELEWGACTFQSMPGSRGEHS